MTLQIDSTFRNILVLFSNVLFFRRSICLVSKSDLSRNITEDISTLAFGPD